MKATSLRVRVCSFLLAVLTSAVVLGGTVIGMESGSGSALSAPDMAMETVTLRLSAVV